ncbi:hypothetical protein [Francisella philomiragia]|uniref:hypothetical protein n=1 Tax=Francisella philomiragia TaxID=28110 RepID=UPI0019085A90|nr:hypothetical protein [Francisella philomiragia]MBK2267825.1 hypothetical protein [Francisella philomiragia]MBK2279075.1 hypothetical protein [Francisella philomiragia]MBK2287136.1 hypothetical protein [Francisella philomiragia]MBK2288907.1 hypothetical protein [Francisella philomiragia]MBK2290625.1 hypothetical protein [Francisella philomiragia]
MNYLRVYLLVFLALLISSCIGVIVPTEDDIHITTITRNDYQLYENNRVKTIYLDKIEHPKNGAVEVYSERQWCGITIMAIIVPIPLWLPLCKSKQTVIYEDNKPKEEVSTYPNSKLYACGPGIWIGTGENITKPQEFCSSMLWRE